MTAHRWSGWPGAWCLDCGCGDPAEMAEADGNVLYADDGEPYSIDPAKRHLYASDECAEPGSNRHNPYVSRPLLREKE